MIKSYAQNQKHAVMYAYNGSKPGCSQLSISNSTQLSLFLFIYWFWSQIVCHRCWLLSHIFAPGCCRQPLSPVSASQCWSISVAVAVAAGRRKWLLLLVVAAIQCWLVLLFDAVTVAIWCYCCCSLAMLFTVAGCFRLSLVAVTSHAHLLMTPVNAGSCLS